MKKSTEAALLKFIRRESLPQKKKAQTGTRGKPEKDTERAVLRWAKAKGLFLHVVDSSSFDSRIGQMGEAKAAAGMPDLIGNTPTGLACFVELKAQGRRSALSELQRHFLEQKIEQNCFAAVVDSAECIDRLWTQYCTLKTSKERQALLSESLPKKKIKAPRDEFEKIHGF